MAINNYRQTPGSTGNLRMCLISQMATKAKTSFTRNSFVQIVCSVLTNKFFITRVYHYFRSFVNPNLKEALS